MGESTLCEAMGLPPRAASVWGDEPLAALSELVSRNLFQLVPASHFTIEQLTAAYNQTRVDYMVPMPMNAARLAEYIALYDVDLEHSVVAVDGDQILGLGMLGVRPAWSWITRLGVLPGRRRRGVGEAIVLYLLTASEHVGAEIVTLEVIKNNLPAYGLFRKWDFQETRELIILRRPPGPPAHAPFGEFRWLDKPEALALADTRPLPLSWINATASFANADGVGGMTVELPDGSYGWLVFQRYRFILTRLTIGMQRGDPTALTHALLAALYQRYPDVDTNVENVSVTNPHLEGFLTAGFVESFRRVEMYRVRTPILPHVVEPVRSIVARRRVLVVDDEENVAMTLQAGLEALDNCEIVVATNGKEAWQLFEQQPFDLLITDYKMPGMDGMTLAARVRERYPHMSIILMTAYGEGDEALRSRADRAAIQRLLSKPVGIAEIRRVAAEELERPAPS